MDFALTDDQQAIADLAQQILQDKASHERQREREKVGWPDGVRFDAEVWKALADAGLLSIAVPEAHGGAGLGFLELAAILEQVGRTVAPVPVLETLVLGALPLAEFGSEPQQKEWLPRVAIGDAILSAALVGDAPVVASADGEGFRLEGTRLFVPSGVQADAILVPVTGDAGSGVFLVRGDAAGLVREALDTTSGQPEARLVLSGVRVGEQDRVGSAGEGDRIVEWITRRASSAVCMVALGACERALELTSEYVKTRKQFDQPIAMFQAVGHRAADAYIDTEAIRLTAWQAAWRIDAGEDAAKQVAVAKFFGSEAGKRVVHAAQHLHGGVGVDREYPLHRYFLYARHLELTLGSGTPQLLELGRLLAS
jgi:alkylation response protein AidB-like acyl-CoA dehydrogenase